MSDGPQQCALPDCTEIVEQPDDGGPRRLYCSPAHRAIARKMRHAARVEPAATQPVSNGADLTQPVSAERAEPDRNDPAASEPPAALAAPSQEPEPTPEPDRDGSLAAATTATPPAAPGRTVRVITSKRVKKQRPIRTAADIKNAAAKMRRRAVASVAIASLVAGGASYMVNENIIPTSPTLPPQSTPQPSMEADVWAGQAEVVLASLSSQLDAVAQAEAAWLALPEPRRAQEPSAVQALKDRKALLEQQRATLMSQLEALRALPELTTELSSAQAQLDAVERTLKESNAAAASPDYQEAVRQLEEQREMRRQQRDHAAQQLADLRDGVENALSAPLPAETDETRPIVERVKAVAEGRPDPAEQDNDSEHNVADGQDSAATPRREDGGDERSDTGTTAPPDPDRPSIPDVLADGARESRADAGRTSQDLGNAGAPADNGGDNNAGNTAGNGADAPRDDEPAGPVNAVAGGLGDVLGGGDSDRSERDDDGGNPWSFRGNDNDRENDRNDDRDNDDDRGGLGDTVRDVGGGLFGGDRDDDRDDDRAEQRGDDRDDSDDRSNWWSGDNDRDDRDDRDDRGDRDDSGDSSGWWSGGGDRDERGDDDERDNQGDDRGGLGDLTDGLIGGSDRERDESEDGNAGQSGEHAEDDEAAGNEDNAGSDEERKRPIGKAERERQRAEENNNDSSSEASDENDEDSASERGNNDQGNNDQGNDDQGNDDRGENNRGESDDNGAGNNGDDDNASNDNAGSDNGSDDNGSDDNGSDDNDGGSDDNGGNGGGSDDDAGDDDGGSDDGGSDDGGGDDDGGSDDGGSDDGGGDDGGGSDGGGDGGDSGGDD